ncbi:DUF4382 domain-containing protein [Natronoarchaeum rubrum]|uniref:DUF4382 domain-containing protein n=1 Tax=Natronoarchaeum rubrum TaxID=755311 RepID=UPI002112A2BD|nr:DUF4382 domain-containing protein [Natronoarchaeum rubrum]
MTRHRSDADGRSDEHSLPRRALLAAGGAAGATLVAGCMGSTNTGSDGGTGSFRLLVTDLPADIGDFDSLKVTLDRARVFRGSGSGDGDESGEDGDESAANDESDGADAGNASADGDTNSSESADDGDDAEEDGESAENDGDSEFFWLDLEGETVDLTQVVGDKAVSVFEGELEAGTYSKVELHAADIEGIVDGERVDVKIPSGKLQIVHEFEIEPDESVSFVFDIHVVKKGNGGYNLRPVISGSGVDGEDVDVEEIDPDEESEGAGGNESDANSTAENGTADGGNESAGDGETSAGSGDGGNDADEQ